MQAFTPPHPSRRSIPHTINPHLASQERRSHGLTVAVGVVIVLIALIAVVSYWKGDKTDDLMLNVVALRKGTAEVVKRSALITQTDEIVNNLGNKRIKNEWEGLSQCMTKGCTDIDYYNFLVTVITQKKVKNGELLYNLILVNKYWGTSEIIDFSQALTKVNEEVEKLGSREVSKKWGQVIECDGKCTEKDDLFFDMIKLIVMTD